MAPAGLPPQRTLHARYLAQAAADRRQHGTALRLGWVAAARSLRLGNFAAYPAPLPRIP